MFIFIKVIGHISDLLTFETDLYYLQVVMQAQYTFKNSYLTKNLKWKEGIKMVQLVNATDKFESQLFQWDMERQIISLPHGKEIWFAKLCENGQFKVFKSTPKPQPGLKVARN